MGERGNARSGADAPQWIEIDLGVPVALGSLRLTVAQFPAAATVHQVVGGAAWHEIKAYGP